MSSLGKEFDSKQVLVIILGSIMTSLGDATFQGLLN